MIRPGQLPLFAQVVSLQSATKPKAETPIVAARHRGRCAGCRGAIRLDEPIQRVDHGWHHEECIPWETAPFVHPRRSVAA